MYKFAVYILTGAVLTGLSLCFCRCQPDAAPVRLDRFEQDLFALDTNRIDDGMKALARKYPDFLPFFLTEIAHDQTNPQEAPREALRGFVCAPQIRRLNDSCQAQYADLGWLQHEIGTMAAQFKKEFPQRRVPHFVTAVTEFVGDAYAVNDTLMMIGLDMFLGENFSGYNPEYFPKYLRRQFQKPFITSKIALAWSSNIAGPPPGDRVLDYMINNGKILYLMGRLLPSAPDSMKMGYTRAQLEGCIANEQEIWARLLAMKVLYEPLNNKNQKIVMPSPSADNVFQEAPGEVGNWIGWQIVNAFMRRNPGTSVEALLNLRDSQQFLEKAKYKPERSN